MPDIMKNVYLKEQTASNNTLILTPKGEPGGAQRVFGKKAHGSFSGTK